MNKICRECKKIKLFEFFDKARENSDGFAKVCKECRSIKAAFLYKTELFRFMNTLKKSKCKKEDIPYNLDEGYLKSIWTDTCPIFGVKLRTHDKTHSDQYALDRIDPNLGYVKGNVAFICSRANRIKYDATIEELELITKWMRSKV